MLGLSVGLISSAYNTDSGSIKNSLQWLIRLVAGDSDSEESRTIALSPTISDLATKTVTIKDDIAKPIKKDR